MVNHETEQATATPDALVSFRIINASPGATTIAFDVRFALVYRVSSAYELK